METIYPVYLFTFKLSVSLGVFLINNIDLAAMRGDRQLLSEGLGRGRGGEEEERWVAASAAPSSIS